MAKIMARSRPGKHGQVKIEGRLDDACVLMVDAVRELGSSIRATFAAQGITGLEPEGQEPNDIALAMVHMQRAVTQHEQEMESNRKKSGKELGGKSAGELNGYAAGEADRWGEVPAEDDGAEELPDGGGPLERTTH